MTVFDSDSHTSKQFVCQQRSCMHSDDSRSVQIKLKTTESHNLLCGIFNECHVLYVAELKILNKVSEMSEQPWKYTEQCSVC